ncbi:unnamed protein product [Boreogadus saida]
MLKALASERAAGQPPPESRPSETLTLTAPHVSATAPQLAEEKEAADRSRGSEVVPGHGGGGGGGRVTAAGARGPEGVLVTPSRALITGARQTEAVSGAISSPSPRCSQRHHSSISAEGGGGGGVLAFAFTTVGSGNKAAIPPGQNVGEEVAWAGLGLAGNRKVASGIPGSASLSVKVSPLSQTPHPDCS